MVKDIGSAIRVVDAFCGCGGLTMGVFEAARAIGRPVELAAAIDVDGDALVVHKSNFHTQIAIQQNVSTLVDWLVTGDGDAARFAYVPEVLEESLEDLRGNVDIFIAGPPCQGHSNFNNKTRRDDPRNLLYISAVALGVALGAKTILLENVPEVVNDRAKVIRTAVSLLGNAGYGWLETNLLGLDQFGGAQTRKRFFLAASRLSTTVELPGLLDVLNSLRRKPEDLRWAIGDLLPPVGSATLGSGIMDSVPTMSSENVARVQHLFLNNLHDLPDSERPESHQQGNTYPSVYGRLWWDRPAQTFTTGFLSPGRGRYVHPLVHRVVTPHEAARIQTFPDGFRFVVGTDVEPSRAGLQKWIGDAVPPMLAYYAALPLMARLAESSQ